MTKSFWRLRFLIVLLLPGAFVACGPRLPKPGATTEEYQRYYSNTKWSWSHIVGISKAPPGLRIQESDYRERSQAHLEMTHGSAILRYTELKPQSGLKSFRGFQHLQKIENVDQPLFRISAESYLGFFSNRVFRIDLVHPKESKALEEEAIQLGTAIIDAHR